jgi:membrane protein
LPAGAARGNARESTGSIAMSNVHQTVRERLLRIRDGVPGLRVTWLAMRNYVRHQSANQAGSVAFSSVLAMFPLLLFLSAAAGFIGQPGAAAQLARRVVAYAPPIVTNALLPVIDEVLSQRNRALLTIGMLVTVWAASSGTQAIRSALNRAYGVRGSMSFWAARIKVTLFTVVGAVGIIFAFGSVIVLPYVWALLEQSLGVSTDVPWVRNSVRYSLAFVVLTAMYAAMYGWLPDIRQKIRTVLPGAIAGAALWLGAAAIFSYTLRSAGKLALVYGGFTGLVATLVFLYASAVTLIFGAEINGVLRDDEEPANEDAERR